MFLDNINGEDVFIVVTDEQLQDLAAGYIYSDHYKRKENDNTFFQETKTLFQTYMQVYQYLSDKAVSVTEREKWKAGTHLSTVKKKIEEKQNEVFRLRERKQAILSGQLKPIPLTLNECETDKATICGTWTLKQGKYHALWNNSAKAVINIVRFDDETVVFTRHDTTGSSIDLRADYEGKRIKEHRAEGTVNWTWNNNKWSGTWYATW